MRQLTVLSMLLTLTLTVSLSIAQGQTTTTDALVAGVKAMHDGVKRNLVAAADKVPEADYAFKATVEVRSFGQLFMHVANSQYFFCGMAKGEEAKADIVKALNESFVYCDGAFAAMAGGKALELVKPPAFMGSSEIPRINLLMGNASHNNEHYGNIVTYMRLKGMVPPSSEGQPRRPSGPDAAGCSAVPNP